MSESFDTSFIEFVYQTFYLGDFLHTYQLIHESADLVHSKLVGNFEIQSKSKVAIIGENGVGKTSLLKYLKSKQAEIFKTQCSILDQIRIRPLADLKVFEVFELVNKELKDILKQPLGKENTLVKEFEFFEHYQKSISNLSGGENQILKIILALNLNVEIYILDEPFSNLSLKNKTKLKSLLQEMDKTLLIIDHDVTTLSEICSKTLELYKEQSVLKIRELK